MKHLKNFEGLFKKKQISTQVIEGTDDSEVNELFNNITLNFKKENLERIDQAMYGYYFRYKIDDNTRLEVGLFTVSISKNNEKFERLNVSKSLISKLVDFFETKGKGGIRPGTPVGY